jgi:hypothetical protein
LQLEVAVADKSDAGTSDTVLVRLNEEEFVLDYADTFHFDGLQKVYDHKDFDRNTRFTYDVLAKDVKTFADVKRLALRKKGNDGLALEQVRLIVNGVPVYARNFGSDGHWIDGNDGHPSTWEVDSQTLRSSPGWLGFEQPFPPLRFSREEIESRLEAQLGHEISFQGSASSLYWGHLHGRAVEVKRKNATTIGVDLDLAKVQKWLPNPEVDVDFDLGFTCENGRIQVALKNFDVDAYEPWFVHVLTLGYGSAFLAGVNTGLAALATALAQTWEIDTQQPWCPEVTVDSDGSVNLSLPFGARLKAAAARQR